MKKIVGYKFNGDTYHETVEISGRTEIDSYHCVLKEGS
jgi:hypothetical protein